MESIFSRLFIGASCRVNNFNSVFLTQEPNRKTLPKMFADKACEEGFCPLPHVGKTPPDIWSYPLFQESKMLNKTSEYIYDFKGNRESLLQNGNLIRDPMNAYTAMINYFIILVQDTAESEARFVITWENKFFVDLLDNVWAYNILYAGLDLYHDVVKLDSENPHWVYGVSKHKLLMGKKPVTFWCPLRLLTTTTDVARYEMLRPGDLIQRMNKQICLVTSNERRKDKTLSTSGRLVKVIQNEKEIELPPYRKFKKIG